MNAEDAILSASTDEYYYFFINRRLQERPESTGSKIMSSLGSLISVNMLGFLRFLIFTTRVDQTNRSTLVKLILFEKSRVELEFVFSIFRQESGNTLETPLASPLSVGGENETTYCTGSGKIFWTGNIYFLMVCPL